MTAQSDWTLMYLGAFGALGVTNLSMAAELAAFTRSDQEAAHVIGVMRRFNGELYPGCVNRALDALREMRQQEAP